MLLIEEIEFGLALDDCVARFPEARIDIPEAKDYDPAFWERTIRYRKFGERSEEIAGISFQVSFAFHRDELMSLQYFGRVASDEAGYDAARDAAMVLRTAVVRFLGAPSSAETFMSFEEFRARPRYDSGPPDERYVPIATTSWPEGYLSCSEDSSRQIAVELRLERRPADEA